MSAEQNTYSEEQKQSEWRTSSGLMPSVLSSPAAAPVMAEYGSLSKECQSLAETVDNLRLRLEPITGPDHPEVERADGAKSVERSLSPLAESLRSDTVRVRDINRELQHLISRLEI